MRAAPVAVSRRRRGRVTHPAPGWLRLAHCQRWRLRCVFVHRSIRNLRLGSSSKLGNTAHGSPIQGSPWSALKARQWCCPHRPVLRPSGVRASCLPQIPTMRRRRGQQFCWHSIVSFEVVVGTGNVVAGRRVEDAQAAVQRRRSSEASAEATSWFRSTIRVQETGMLLPCVVSDAAWGSKGGGGAVLLTQARQDLLVLRATDLSRSSTTDLAALTDALAALAEGGGGSYECDTSAADAGRVLCRRVLSAARSNAAARSSVFCAASRRPRAPVRATSSGS